MNKEDIIAMARMAENERELGLDYMEPVPPPECKTDAEKTAFAFGWGKALEENRKQLAQQGCMRCNTPKKCALYGCSPLTWPSEQPAQQQEPHEWLTGCPDCGMDGDCDCNTLAEQPAQQEPVAYLVYAKGTRRYFTLTFDVEKVPEIYKGGEAVPLYTSPPASKPLTDEEMDEMRQESKLDFVTLREFRVIARAVEAKLKEKNG